MPSCSSSSGRSLTRTEIRACADRARALQRRDRLCGIELIDVGRRNGLQSAAGAQIFRTHVRVGRQEFNGAPLPPAAFMASIGLPIRHLLTQALDDIAEP